MQPDLGRRRGRQPDSTLGGRNRDGKLPDLATVTASPCAAMASAAAKL